MEQMGYGMDAMMFQQPQAPQYANYMYQNPGSCIILVPFCVANYIYQNPGSCIILVPFCVANYMYQNPGSCMILVPFCVALSKNR